MYVLDTNVISNLHKNYYRKRYQLQHHGLS